MENKKKGLIVNVFRTDYDATNLGITNSKDNVKRLTLIGSEDCLVDEVFEDIDENILVLKKRVFNNTEYLYAVPFKITIDQSFMNGPMFGGNFIYCSDSRFPNKYPIPVHDRFEH